MIYRNHCICLIVLPPVFAVSCFTGSPHSSVASRSSHHRRKAPLERSEADEPYRSMRFTSHDWMAEHGLRVWHHNSSSVHTSKFTGMGGRGPRMESAGRKEDELGDSVPVSSEVTPAFSQPLDQSGLASTAMSLGTALSSASIPVSSAMYTGTTSAAAPSSTQSQSLGEIQAAHPTPASALAATSRSSSSSTSSFQPALLAFILVPVCVFLLGTIFALYRIYGKPGNRNPPASPTFLGDATALGSGYHRDEAIALNEPNMQSRASILGYNRDKRGAIKWEPLVERDPSRRGVGVIKGHILKDVPAFHDLKPPFPTYVAVNYNASPPRVLRPNAPRSYHRPHPAYTTDPEVVMPLIASSSQNKPANYRQGGSTTPNPKGKGKENIARIKGHGARKHRDDISATPPNTSPRSVPFRDPVTSAVFSDLDIRHQARAQGSPTSLVSITKDKNQLKVPSQSSTSTSFDIGLAMLTGFASPSVGLGLDMTPCPPSPEHISPRVVSQTAESLISPSMRKPSREATLPHLQHSMTAGSKGLAYLSANDSPEMMLPDKPSDDELDIASALAVYKTQQAGDRLKAQKDRAEQKTMHQRTGKEIQDSPASSSSCELEARYTPSDVKAPTLPTLSEMALSRADPLYESVTSELFSSYGMRMSTATGPGRPSRVSARISRMLSWFAGTDSSNTGSRISGIENRMSCEESNFAAEGHGGQMSSMSSPGSVQPLRIGKVRKNVM